MMQQVRFVPVCMKSKICQEIVRRLEGVRQLRSVISDRVLLSVDDFNEVTLPAVQFIDNGDEATSEKTRSRIEWIITLEVVMKATQWETVTQYDLWNLMQVVKRAMGENPGLSIPGVIHIEYLSSATDLHLLESHYIGKLTFKVLYYEAFVRFEC